MVGHVGFVWRQLELCVFRAQLRLRTFLFYGGIVNEKTLKRTLATLLAVIMIAGTAPLSGFVGFELTSITDIFSVKAIATVNETGGMCGENVTWTFDEKTRTLTIDGEGAMDYYNYTPGLGGDHAPWYSLVEFVEIVVIGSDITRIDSYALYHCKNITEIKVNAENEYYITDDRGILYKSDMSLLVKCPSNLKGKYIASESIEIAPGAFIGVDEDFIIACHAPSSAFFYAVNYAVNYEILSWKDAEGQCGENITGVITKDGKLTINGNGYFYEYGDLFYYDYKNFIKEIEIKSGVKNVKGFSDCINLEKISLPETVERIENSAFYGCSRLSSIELPDSVTYIDAYAFWSCCNLTDIKIPNNLQCVDGGNPFYETAYWNNQNNWENGVFYFGDFLIDSNSEVIEGEHAVKDGTKMICSGAFYGCENLIEVVIPETVKTIDLNAFVFCDNLKSVYYMGSQSEWKQMNVKLGSSISDALVNAKIYFAKNEGESEIKTESVSDTTTEISMEYISNFYAGEVDIAVETTSDRADFEIVCTEFDIAESIIYNIKMIVDGIETQPNGTVKVKIPIPEGYDSAKTFVYHVDTNSGRVENMGAVVEVFNGKEYLVFDTDHFSYYAVVEKNIDTGAFSAVIATPSTTTIKYGDSIILHADVTGTLPAGATIQWSTDNGNFEKVAANDGMTCRITPKSSGNTTFTIKVVAENGKVIAEDTQTMTSKAGFFDKLIAFFKKLFGLTKVIPQAFKAIK